MHQRSNRVKATTSTTRRPTNAKSVVQTPSKTPKMSVNALVLKASTRKMTRGSTFCLNVSSVILPCKRRQTVNPLVARLVVAMLCTIPLKRRVSVLKDPEPPTLTLTVLNYLTSFAKCVRGIRTVDRQKAAAAPFGSVKHVPISR